MRKIYLSLVIILFISCSQLISLAQNAKLGTDICTGSVVNEPLFASSSWIGERYAIKEYLQIGAFTGFTSHTGITILNDNTANVFEVGSYIHGDILQKTVSPYYTVRGGYNMGSLGDYKATGFSFTAELGAKYQINTSMSLGISTCYGIASYNFTRKTDNSNIASFVFPIMPVYVRFFYN